MENPTNKMDDVIKKALKGYDVPYNPQDWKRMEQMLDEPQRAVPLWWRPTMTKILAAAMLVVALSFSVYQYGLWEQGTGAKSVSEMVKKPTGTSSVNAAKQSLEAAAIYPQSQSATHAVAKHQNLVKDQTPSELIASEQAKKTVQKTTNSHLAIEKTENFTVGSNNSIIFAKKQADHTIKNQKDSYYSFGNEHKPTYTSLEHANLTPTSTLTQHTTQLTKAIAEAAKTQPLVTVPSLRASYIQNMAAPITQALPSKASLVTDATPLPTLPKNPTSTLRITAVSSVDANFTDFTTGPQAGYSAGLTLDKKITKRWSIESGALYAHKTFETKNEGLLFTQAADFQTNYGVQYIPQNLVTHLQLIEIPVLAKYHIRPHKKWQPYVSAGLAAYIPIKENYTYTTTFNPIDNNATPPIEIDVPIWTDTMSNVFAPLPPPESILLDQGYEVASVAEEEYRVNSVERPSNPYWGVARINTGFTYRFAKICHLQLEAQLRASLPKYKFDRSRLEKDHASLNDLPQSSTTYNRKRLYTIGLQAGFAIDL